MSGPAHGPEAPKCRSWAGMKYETPQCDLVKGHAGPHSMDTEGARVWWGQTSEVEVLSKFFRHADLVVHPWLADAYVDLHAKGDPYTPHGATLNHAEAEVLLAWWESLR